MTTTTTEVVELGTKEVTTRFGKKSTYSFKGNDGNWYKMAFKKPKFAKGDTVTFSYTEGTYGKDIDGEVEVQSTASTDTGGSVAINSKNQGGNMGRGSYGTFPVGLLDSQRAIIRQNALTNAREVYVAVCLQEGGDYTHEKTAKEIIELARIFESYTAGDTEREEADALRKT